MRTALRLLPLALAAALIGAAGAQATITGTPHVIVSPYTKVAPLAPGSSSALLVINITPPTFTVPEPTGHIDVSAVDAEFASPPLIGGANPGLTSAPLVVTDGHLYNLAVSACETLADPCTAVPGAPTATGQTRMDGVPPSGTLQINGGAVATNNRAVTLNLAATDPLIGGLAGSSSGITQYALDVDGDGTFPCPPFPGLGDESGCARDFSPTAPLTVSAGDGPKKIGVVYGDGARPTVAPCIPPPGVFCAVFITNPVILGNASAPATAQIILDTAKPLAVAGQDRFTVDRGGAVSFDAGSSADPNGANGSGIDPAATIWDFKDGTPPAAGQKVTHTFAQAGTFVGELRVKDRAGNQSDPRPFSVTVNPRPGEATAGAGTAGAVTAGQGNAAFKIDTIKVSARYAKSKLNGRVTVSGSSTQAGPLTVEVRLRGRRVATVATTLGVLALPNMRNIRPSSVSGRFGRRGGFSACGVPGAIAPARDGGAPVGVSSFLPY